MTQLSNNGFCQFRIQNFLSTGILASVIYSSFVKSSIVEFYTNRAYIIILPHPFLLYESTGIVRRMICYPYTQL